MIKAFSNISQKTYSEQEYGELCKKYPKAVTVLKKNGYTYEERYTEDDEDSIFLIVDSNSLGNVLSADFLPYDPESYKWKIRR